MMWSMEEGDGITILDKSMAVTIGVWMWKFIKHHKAKPSIREQKPQRRGK